MRVADQLTLNRACGFSVNSGPAGGGPGAARGCIWLYRWPPGRDCIWWWRPEPSVLRTCALLECSLLACVAPAGAVVQERLRLPQHGGVPVCGAVVDGGAVAAAEGRRVLDYLYEALTGSRGRPGQVTVAADAQGGQVAEDVVQAGQVEAGEVEGRRLARPGEDGVDGRGVGAAGRRTDVVVNDPVEGRGVADGALGGDEAPVLA